jgi:hypothetical protein
MKWYYTIAAVFVLLLPGCVGTHVISLDPSMLGPSRLKSRLADLSSHRLKKPTAAPAAKVVPTNGPLLHVSQFVDLRTVKNPLIQATNPFGLTTLRINSKDTIAQWITAGICRELQRTGFRLADSGDVTTPCLSGELREIRGAAAMIYQAEITLSVALDVGGNRMYERTYTGYGNGGTSYFGQPREYGRCLNLALNDAAWQVVHDIDSLLGDTAKTGNTALPQAGDPLNLDSLCNLDRHMVKIAGPRPVAGILRDLDALDFRKLHTSRLDLNPGVSGDVFVLIEFGADGLIGSVKIARSTLNDPILTGQTVALIGNHRSTVREFYPQKSAAIYRVTFPKRNVVVEKRGLFIALAVLLAVPLGVALATLQ